MQNGENFRESQEGWAKRRRVALAIKIALGQAEPLEVQPQLSEDACDSTYFDMGFEMGYDASLRSIIAVLQGIAAGFDQLLEDTPANDNQRRFEFEE